MISFNLVGLNLEHENSSGSWLILAPN
uniref:Uncharacterized protein n=1 Tax=Rhizophora mucronata TaxID=61149 RepID=A0A2P2NE09_RHIMU